MYDHEAELYCAAFGWSVEAEVDWWVEHAGHVLGRRPASVLEPLCGNGRYGPAFADRGLDYTGFDASPQMLARAPSDPRLTLARADALDVDLDLSTGPFDLAWCPINSLRHLPSEDALARHFRAVRAKLSSDGLYVVQVALFGAEDLDREPDEGAQWTLAEPDGAEVVARWWYENLDRRRRRVVEGFRFERRRDGRAEAEVEGRYSMLALSLGAWQCAAGTGGLELVEARRPTEPPAAIDPAALAGCDADNVYLVLTPR